MYGGTYLCLRVPMDVCRSLLVSEGTCWYLKVPTTVILGYLLVPEGAYGSSRVCTGV